MLIALNKKKKFVSATNELCRTDSFYCPSCRGRVCLKVGQINRPHFAHYQKEDCYSFSEGETEEHLKGKLQLATYLKMKVKNVQLEAYLPDLKQRPDILVEKENQKIAIEFQCSPISIGLIVERTQGYLERNYEVIWILGKHFNYQGRLTAFHKACLYSAIENKQLLLIHYDAYIDRLSIRYDFQLLRNGQIDCQLEQIELNGKKSIQLTKGKKIKEYDDRSFKDIKRRHERFLKEIRYPNPQVQDFLKTIYLDKENIVSLPIEIYYTVRSEWMIQTYSMKWKYQFILWLESFPEKKILTRKTLQLWIDQQIETKLIVYYQGLRLTEELYLRPFIEWIELLEKREILKEIGYLKWSYQQPLKRYKYLEEKFGANL